MQFSMLCKIYYDYDDRLCKIYFSIYTKYIPKYVIECLTSSVLSIITSVKVNLFSVS